MDNETLRNFAIEPQDVKLILHLQRELILKDIDADSDEKSMAKKQAWLGLWQRLMGDQLSASLTGEGDWFADNADFTPRLAQLQLPENRLKAGIILLEVLMMKPYTPLQEAPTPTTDAETPAKTKFATTDANGNGGRLNFKGMREVAAQRMAEARVMAQQTLEKSRETAENTLAEAKRRVSNPEEMAELFTLPPQRNKQLWDKNLRYTAVYLGYEPEDAARLINSVTQTTNQLTQKWQKLGLFTLGGLALGALTLGAAAPMVALGIGGAAGLSGAAAFTSGMAALGGVVGGGMFAGSVVMLGGGAIIGITSGGIAGGAVTALSEKQLAVEVIKLEVVLKEIVLQQRDMATYYQILDQQRETINTYEMELDKLRRDSKANEEQIKKLEQVVNVLKTSLRRMQANVDGMGDSNDDDGTET